MESWWDRKFYFPLHLPFDAFGPNKDLLAYEMLQNLREIYEGKARQERYDTSKALFQCKITEGTPVGGHCWDRRHQKVSAAENKIFDPTRIPCIVS